MIGNGISIFKGGGGGFPPPETIGLVLDNTNFMNHGSDWTEEGAGITWTYNANTIYSVSAGSGYASLTRYNQWSTHGEEFTIKSRVIFNSTGGTNIYFGVGFQGVSTFSQKMHVVGALWAGSGFTGLTELYYGNNFTTGNVIIASSGATKIAIADGDEMEYEITQSTSTGSTVITFTVRNLTNPTGDQTISWDNTDALDYAYGMASNLLLNIEQIALFNYKGDYTVTLLEYYLNDSKNIYGQLVGDSKLEGYYVDALANRVSNLLADLTSGLFQVSAGSGDVTQDILNAMPEILLQNAQNVVLCIGRNDVADKVLQATWKVNYKSIVAQLKANGSRVIHLLPIPESSLDQSALYNFITNEPLFASDTKVDVSPTWVIATDCSADGSHLTQAGATKVANYIYAAL